MVDVTQAKKVHFIGIGGIGMSGLARLYQHEGTVVSGSDTQETELTRTLEKEGIAVTYKQTADNLSTWGSNPQVGELVVYTEAVSPDNPELVAAKEAGIKTIPYFAALGEVANQYYLIAVAGTHGKTTTTAMLTDILEEASYDPTAIIGSLRTKTGSNYRPGQGKYFIAEACEYREDFKYLEPDLLVITNVEHEHVDYYPDLAAVQAAFRKLAEAVPEEGIIVCDTSDENVAPVVADVKATVVDYRAAIDPLLQLHTPGLHNRRNAAAAAAAAAELGIEPNKIKTALENFAGVWRRFEFKGEVNGAKIYDEYAHHPTEIKAAIASARELYPDRQVTVVFQPHTYSRTHGLFDEFVEALAKADATILVPIYAAREENVSGVTSEQLVAALTKTDQNSQFFYTLPAAAQAVKETASPNDVVLVMGAGDVTQVTDHLMS